MKSYNLIIFYVQLFAFNTTQIEHKSFREPGFSLSCSILYIHEMSAYGVAASLGLLIILNEGKFKFG